MSNKIVVDATTIKIVKTNAGAGLDTSAIHNNVAGEIAAVTEKGSPASGDYILVEDSADSNNKKMVQIGNLPTGTGMASFELAGTSGSAQTITNGNTVTIAAGTGVTTTAGATDTVTIALDSSTQTALSNSASHISSTSNPHSVDETDILPTQTGNSGKYLTTDGTNSSWAAVAGGGSMSSFTVAGDSGSSQTISDGNTLTIAGGTGISSVAGATDTITLNIDSTVTTLTGTQTLTNKTLTTPEITLKQSAAPAPTAEGDIQWDTDDNKIKIGDGSGTKTFSDDTSNASTYAATAKGVTNGDSHDHSGGDGAQIAYSGLSGIPSTFAPASHDNTAHSATYITISTTDTLTNKTINADNNTISNLAHGSEVDNPATAHGATGAVMGTTNSQYVTNKYVDQVIIKGNGNVAAAIENGDWRQYANASGNLVTEIREGGAWTLRNTFTSS